MSTRHFFKFHLLAILLAGSFLPLLCACFTVATDFLEYSVDKSVQGANKGVLSDDKERRKEIERLKQEGKCPLCRGAGRTADGRLTCASCNGTGKYPNP